MVRLQTFILALEQAQLWKQAIESTQQMSKALSLSLPSRPPYCIHAKEPRTLLMIIFLSQQTAVNNKSPKEQCSP